MNKESKYVSIFAGIGVTLNKRRMSESELQKREAMYKNHAFEEYVSELISLNRSLPDFRGQWCRNQYDNKIDHLEKVSIIICFHNEAWSTLLRSVHSIVNRTPKSLIHEILLVDDKSDKDHLGQRLDDYVAENFPSGTYKIFTAFFTICIFLEISTLQKMIQKPLNTE